MNTPWNPSLLVASLAVLMTGCASLSSRRAPEPVVLVGVLERSEIEAAEPRWVEAQSEAEVDPAEASRLAEVEEGAEVTIFLGTWCGDSRRELARLWHALDGIEAELPFPIEYIGVDREKHEPAERTAGRDIEYVPTLIVSRGGVEVGRIVESAPAGVESDLADLLSGEKTGVISGRDDLGEAEGETDGESESR